MFFFEKKNQKTFIPALRGYAVQLTDHADPALQSST
jgi:hypothetical protein